MKVYLASVRNDLECRNNYEIFKDESDAVEWIRQQLEELGNNHKTSDGLIVIRKSHNSNFWQIVNQTDDGHTPLSVGYGFMYIKEVK